LRGQETQNSRSQTPRAWNLLRRYIHPNQSATDNKLLTINKRVPVPKGTQRTSLATITHTKPKQPNRKRQRDDDDDTQQTSQQIYQSPTSLRRRQDSARQQRIKEPASMTRETTGTDSALLGTRQVILNLTKSLFRADKETWHFSPNKRERRGPKRFRHPLPSMLITHQSLTDTNGDFTEGYTRYDG
jgi:hypothetical protein